jgi:hypothetical protein
MEQIQPNDDDADITSSVPWDFRGRYTIGCFFFILNMVLFVFNITMISLPAWLISLGTILINIAEYGSDNPEAGPWLRETMRVLFWVYCGLAVVFSCGIYLTM